MSIRTKENQQKHDKEVLRCAQLLAKKGWAVLADLPNAKKPPQIGAFIPDIYAVGKLREVIVEIETVDSKGTEHAVLQALAFKSWERIARNRKFVTRVV